jgi:L-amino acid N-acyltransferase YncA
MYVRAPARGTGLAGELVQAVLNHAKERVVLIQLSVVIGNAGARRLYERFGFTQYGIVERSLKVAGRYLDEVLMARRFDCSGRFNSGDRAGFGSGTAAWSRPRRREESGARTAL